MIKKKRKYTREFKFEAVKLVTEGGLRPKVVAERFGLTGVTLYRWISEFEEYGDEAFCGSGKALTQAAKDRKKDKRIAELEEELEILKKAAAYFAKKREQK